MSRSFVLDTIDLQDQDAPSAKDHSRLPANPSRRGGPSPHQAEALKNVAEEQNVEQAQRSPRVSLEWSEGVESLREEPQSYDDEEERGRQPQQQDNLAVQQNGGNGGLTEDTDLADSEGDDGLDDDMMDKISSSPSIDDEDIDFEFVYALHTFVATVEGQANATKGDTMVLLDDSNSYWWLVRVVKDSSIGYLPAEHIETPTERLARLNKHRNIDLSQTMLGDNPEKSKNPLKKAMRRRNAKTVQFTAPTYFEASDVEYSSSEEDGEGEFFGNEEEATESQQAQQEDDDDTATVEPLKVRSNGKVAKTESKVQADPSREAYEEEQITIMEASRMSEDSLDRQGDGASAKSRNGTVRNTDSFFKDDNVETRKITLTPNLLRDDSNGSLTSPVESKEIKPRTSTETLEKTVSPPEKAKDDKKKKEKKAGMLSGLFKRKDRKTKGPDDDGDDAEKHSDEISLDPSPQPNGSEESSPLEPSASLSWPQPAQQQPQPQRQSSKLQKQPPANHVIARDQTSTTEPDGRKQGNSNIPAPDRPAPSLDESAPTLRLVEPEIEQRSAKPAPLRIRSPEPPTEQGATLEPKKEPKVGGGKFSPITNMLKSSNSTPSEPKPEKVKKAKNRVELDDFDSSPDIEENVDSFARGHPESPAVETSEVTNERLSESPIEVSPVDAPHSSHHPPGLVVDTSSQEEDRTASPVSPVSPSSTPEMIEEHDAKNYGDTPTSTGQTSTANSTWSDASLRTYFEDDTDIRDLLIIVHDKSGVVPAGPDHPITGSLFREETESLARITTQLDSLLEDWLARRSKTTAVR
ncbi:MAG: hypothetical protein M1819_000404 [Sarea resinae]|nr:MAG: hypothetical protein M1819_000404 [Sarea resinae]